MNSTNKCINLDFNKIEQWSAKIDESDKRDSKLFLGALLVGLVGIAILSVGVVVQGLPIIFVGCVLSLPAIGVGAWVVLKKDLPLKDDKSSEKILEFLKEYPVSPRLSDRALRELCEVR